MGHALNGAIQDALIRYHRMRGRRTKWIFGTDHASIATQRQVERELLQPGHQPRGARPRGASSSATWSWRERYGATIVEQYKRLGASCDYADERFTMDEAYAEAVAARLRRALRARLHPPRQLHRQLGPGLAARRSPTSRSRSARRPTRCTRSPTRSPTATGELVVATVRPETMLADSAVAVQPGRRALRARSSAREVDPAAGRAAPADHRRRLRQARLRHRARSRSRPATTPTTSRSAAATASRRTRVIGEDGRMTAQAAGASPG